MINVMLSFLADNSVGGVTYGNNLCTNEREGSLCHDSPPGKETTLRAREPVVLSEGPRLLPIPKTDAIVVGSTTEVKHDAKYNESCYCDYLDRCEYKFCFSVCPYQMTFSLVLGVT